MKLLGDREARELASPDPQSGNSDESLLARARAGDRGAFAELWQRHARSGLRVARQFTSSVEADDLVSEAYVRIYERILAGGGPVAAFRPYLYTTIRNLASRWGGSNREIQVDDIGEFEDPASGDDPATAALDRTLTAQAFRALPARWQAVLWYTEVEGMDPHEVAPILGLTANGVAALSYRAREGLRKAWLQAHISDSTSLGECNWTVARLGDYARNGLSDRDYRRLEGHLASCAKCGLLSEEVDEAASQLAVVMLPILLGTVVGGSLLAALAAPGAATAAQLAAPLLPSAFHVAASAAPAALAAPIAATGAAVATPALVGTLALALVVSGGLAVGMSRDVGPSVQQPSSAQAPSIPGGHAIGGERSGVMRDDAAQGAGAQGGAGQGSDVQGGIPLANGLQVADGGLDGAVRSVADGLGSTVGGVTDTLGAVVDDITSPLNTIIPSLPVHPGPVPEHSAPDGLVGVAASVDLSGTGMPGATVSAQAGGVVYATAVVTSQGTWAIHISALPKGVGAVSLKQNLRILGITVPLDIPLGLLSTTLGITVELLN